MTPVERSESGTTNEHSDTGSNNVLSYAESTSSVSLSFSLPRQQHCCRCCCSLCTPSPPFTCSNECNHTALDAALHCYTTHLAPDTRLIQLFLPLTVLTPSLTSTRLASSPASYATRLRATRSSPLLFSSLAFSLWQREPVSQGDTGGRREQEVKREWNSSGLFSLSAVVSVNVSIHGARQHFLSLTHSLTH